MGMGFTLLAGAQATAAMLASWGASAVRSHASGAHAVRPTHPQRTALRLSLSRRAMGSAEGGWSRPVAVTLPTQTGRADWVRLGLPSVSLGDGSSASSGASGLLTVESFPSPQEAAVATNKPGGAAVPVCEATDGGQHWHHAPISPGATAAANLGGGSMRLPCASARRPGRAGGGEAEAPGFGLRRRARATGWPPSWRRQRPSGRRPRQWRPRTLAPDPAARVRFAAAPVVPAAGRSLRGSPKSSPPIPGRRAAAPRRQATPDGLYGRPANRFVAAFVGTPPMNVLSGTLERHQDQLPCGWVQAAPCPCRQPTGGPSNRSSPPAPRWASARSTCCAVRGHRSPALPHRGGGAHGPRGAGHRSADGQPLIARAATGFAATPGDLISAQRRPLENRPKKIPRTPLLEQELAARCRI